MCHRRKLRRGTSTLDAWAFGRRNPLVSVSVECVCVWERMPLTFTPQSAAEVAALMAAHDAASAWTKAANAAWLRSAVAAGSLPPECFSVVAPSTPKTAPRQAMLSDEEELSPVLPARDARAAARPTAVEEARHSALAAGLWPASYPSAAAASISIAADSITPPMPRRTVFAAVPPLQQVIGQLTREDGPTAARSQQSAAAAAQARAASSIPYSSAVVDATRARAAAAPPAIAVRQTSTATARVALGAARRATVEEEEAAASINAVSRMFHARPLPSFMRRRSSTGASVPVVTIALDGLDDSEPLPATRASPAALAAAASQLSLAMPIIQAEYAFADFGAAISSISGVAKHLYAGYGGGGGLSVQQFSALAADMGLTDGSESPGEATPLSTAHVETVHERVRGEGSSMSYPQFVSALLMLAVLIFGPTPAQPRYASPLRALLSTYPAFPIRLPAALPAPSTVSGPVVEPRRAWDVEAVPPAAAKEEAAALSEAGVALLDEISARIAAIRSPPRLSRELRVGDLSQAGSAAFPSALAAQEQAAEADTSLPGLDGQPQFSPASPTSARVPGLLSVHSRRELGGGSPTRPFSLAEPLPAGYSFLDVPAPPRGRATATPGMQESAARALSQSSRPVARPAAPRPASQHPQEHSSAADASREATILPDAYLRALNPSGVAAVPSYMRRVLHEDRTALRTIFKHYSELRATSKTASKMASLPGGAGASWHKAFLASVPDAVTANRSVLLLPDILRIGHEFGLSPTLLCAADVAELFHATPSVQGLHHRDGSALHAIDESHLLELLGRVALAVWHFSGPMVSPSACARLLLQRLDESGGREAMLARARGAFSLRFSARGRGGGPPM